MIITFISLFGGHYIYVRTLATPKSKFNHWYKSLKQGLAAAKEKKQPLVVKIGSKTCAPCLKMDKYTLVTPEVESFKNNICFAKLDFEKDMQEIDPLALSSIPTTIFYNKDGKELKRITGFIDRDNFVKYLKQLLKK